MAVQESQESENTSSGSEAAGAEGKDAIHEGGQIDFKELFSTQREQFSQELGKRDVELGKQGKTLDNLRKALMGDEGKESKLDPIDSQIQQAGAEIDQYLEAALAAERAGKPIPLTVNAAIKGLQFKIEALNDKKAHQKEMADMKAQLARLSDPGNRIDEQAFSAMDSHLTSALHTIYGPGDEDTKNLQFEAISKQIGKEIRDLRKEDPEMWDRIRRDKNAQNKMVNHFVKKSIPPRARQIMEEDEIRRTPLGIGELRAAWNEAKELAVKKPDMQRHADDIRRELLSRLMEKNLGGGARSRMEG